MKASTNNTVSWAGGTSSDTITGINRFIFSATQANDLTSKAGFATRVGFTNTPNGTVSQIHNFSYDNISNGLARDHFDLSAYFTGNAFGSLHAVAITGSPGNEGYTVRNNYIQFVQATNTDTAQTAGGLDVYIAADGLGTYNANDKVAHVNFGNVIGGGASGTVDDVDAYLNYLITHTININNI